MKKLLAMLLAALMLVCVGVAALADASITFQMGGEPECMDPTINDYSSGSYALQSLFRGLYKYDADGALVPAMSEDGCTYTFKLKEGLKWSDGSPLTAHDFEYSWKRVLNPEVGSETAYTLYGVIKDGYECFVNKTVSVDDLPIRALDDTTFQVELKAPDRLHRVHAGEPGERGEVWRRLGEQPGNLCLQRPVHAGGHEEGRELHLRQEPELLQCRRSADRHRQLCVPQCAGDGEDGV